MNQRDYFDAIDKLLYKFCDENDAYYMEQLEELKTIKPVRLNWYVSKAKMLLQQGDSLAVAEKCIDVAYFSQIRHEGLRECLDMKSDIAKLRKDKVLADRYQYIKGKLYCDSGISEFDEELDHYLQLYLENKADKESVLRMAQLFLITDNLPGYYLMTEYYGRVLEKKYCGRRWVEQLPNYGYLKEKIEKGKQMVILLIENPKERLVYCALAKALTQLELSVNLLDLPIQRNVMSMQEAVKESIENSCAKDGYCIIRPIEMLENGIPIRDNTDYIIDALISDNEHENCLLLANSRALEEIFRRPKLHNRGQNLNSYQQGYLTEKISFGWVGNYLAYIEEIYGEDMGSKMKEKASCKFSIVIPARNSSTTLRHTIRTCLEQTYNGDYEIIVSDNSIGQNAAVYELCKEIDDPRIIYIKTPSNLHLPKSFEYAYLHASGEYIFAVGSDDGLLPWALDTLAQIAEAYPCEEIIQWERGFYAWPGFNGGQQHQLTIPGAYDKMDYKIYYRDNIDYIASVLNNPSEMYSLPMLYINSCFKRSYFQTLLNKTGALWDGICQDIYMGVVTACINAKILNIKYPLTIAGMSSGSIGADANSAKKTDAEFEKMMREVRADNNIGGFCSSAYERLLPQTGTDTAALYGSLLRAIAIGVLPESYLTEVFDWKKMFRRLADELDIRDVAFDRKIHNMRYAAMQHGEDFLEWFDKVIYNPMLEPHMLDEGHLYQAEQRKTYTNHRTENGGMVLDASEHGVENIHDAVQLFVRLSELG